ncbi:hypothetical protein BKA57DRAFT_40590 [Linnemannia elongata]|nr:hypothetical protein BKA57DRAFT_40590 [Linnemannia elongata]
MYPFLLLSLFLLPPLSLLLSPSLSRSHFRVTPPLPLFQSMSPPLQFAPPRSLSHPLATAMDFFPLPLYCP